MFKRIPLRGKHFKNCVIVGVNIGSYVHIGKNSIISQSCVIKDCCHILPNSVVMVNLAI
jgi:carbonic anhydrase/acetyltransferase-like protein (isoleucine patch superfamily)